MVIISVCSNGGVQNFCQSAYQLLGFNVNRNSLSSCGSVSLPLPSIFVWHMGLFPQRGRPFFGSTGAINLILKKW